MITGHVPDAATWDCRDCGAPWPCDPAREQLAAAMDAHMLGIYMASLLHDAARAMPMCPPAELHERFLAWIRPHPELAS